MSKSTPKRAGERSGSFGLAKLGFCRLFGAYFLVSTYELLRLAAQGIPTIGRWEDFTAAVSVGEKALWTALVFVWFSIVHRCCGEKKRFWDQLLLIFSSTAFALCLVFRSNSFFLGLGAGAVAAIFSAYAVSLLPEGFRLRGRLPALIAFLTAAGVFLFVAATTVDKQRAFGMPCFDMGIFAQTFHSLRENLTAVTSCERDRFMSHFDVHASYIFYLILPVYALFPKPETLLILQALFTVSGVVPLYLIAKNRGFKGGSLLSVCFIYIFSAGLIMPCYYSFHENGLLPALLMWLIYAVDRRNMPLFYVMSALVCIVKEDAPLYVITLGLYLFAEEKGSERLHGIVGSGLSALYFIIVMSRLTESGDGAYMTLTRLGILMNSHSSGFAGIVGNVLTDPGYFLSLFVNKDGLLFLAETLLPLLLLPFFTSKLRRFILIVPYVIMCLVIGSGYSYASDIGFQYIFGPECLLIYMAVLNAGDMPEKMSSRLLTAAAVLSAVTVFSLATPKLSYTQDYRLNRASYEAAEECIDKIPEEGSVLSNTFFVSHACDRAEIYDLGNDKIRTLDDGSVELVEPERYDYLLMSLKDPITDRVRASLESRGWQVFASTDDFVIIFENPRCQTSDVR